MPEGLIGYAISPGRELNPRPIAYETIALPLSYRGALLDNISERLLNSGRNIFEVGDMDGTDTNSTGGQNVSAPSAGPAQPVQDQQIPSQQPATYAQFKMPGTGPSKRTVIIAAVIVVLIAAGLYLYGSTVPTNKYTTTILSGPGILTGCTGISAPGNYLIESEIRTPIQSGACIAISASHVNLICNNGKLVGSGPYTGVPPFTYGIALTNADNVSISGCEVKNFSYGIYALSSSNLLIHDNNVSTDYLSNIRFNGTRNSSVYSNLLSGSASPKGSLYLGDNSSGNRVYNNTVLRNQYYGIIVNSTGNLFLNNYVNATPVSFYCGAGNGFKGDNIASSNLCFNATGCEFIQCHGTNRPVDLSQLRLNGSIGSCGAIEAPGSYTLSKNVNMGSYVNVSAEQQYGTPCITIKSGDVALNCNNLGVFNSTTGIAAYNASNVTIRNCNVWNSNAGISLVNVRSSNLYNTTLRNDSTGLMMNDSNSDNLFGTRAFSGTYGLYLLNSSSNNFQVFNLSDNRYGIYVNGSLGETFSNGAALGNLDYDVYASPNSANSSYSLMLSSTCALTNTQWATCKQHTSTNATYTPINSCGALTRPGIYTLTANVINGPAMCIGIMSNDISLDCLSHSIIAPQATAGPAFVIDGKSNVTIKNCTTLNFGTGIAVYDSSNLAIMSDNITNGEYGITMHNVTNSTVLNNNVAETTNASILLNRVRGSEIAYNNAAYGRIKSVGLILNNSIDNKILNNNLFTDYVGMSLNGTSRDNLINNNTAQFSASLDYSCDANSSDLNANQGGIDYGTTKLGCRWLAVLQKGSAQAPCTSILQSEGILLISDALYNLNATCFNVYASDTKINCNGHTIIATSNGSLVQFTNSPNSELSNCYLKGFQGPIKVVNSSATILNNTMYLNGTAAAINVTDSFEPMISRNNITFANGITGLYGIYINSSANGGLLNNTVNGANTAYWMGNTTTFNIRNNSATSNDAVGMYLTKSMSDQFYRNSFLAKTTGIDCECCSRRATSRTPTTAACSARQA